MTGGGIYNVLFLCTGNSARSILAEALIDHWGKRRFKGYSAGSFPKGSVHPLAVDLLEKAHLDTSRLRSKSWGRVRPSWHAGDGFCLHGLRRGGRRSLPDVAGEPGDRPWGIPDPAAVPGTDVQRHKPFALPISNSKTEIKVFTALPISRLDRLAIKRQVDEIGRLRAVPK
jgi:hypothetical protein